MDIVTGIIFGGIVFLYLISLIKGFKLSKREEYIKSFESLNLSIQEACNSISQTTTGIEMIGEIREETNYILNELYPLSSNFELEEITKLASKSRRVYNRLRAKTFPLSLWADTFSMIGETFENVIICFICSEGNPFLKESKPIKIISEGMYTYITNGLNLALKELDEGRDEDRFSNYLYNLQKQLWYWKENIFDKWPQFREEDIPRVPKGGLFSLMVLSPGNPFAVSRWSMR